MHAHGEKHLLDAKCDRRRQHHVRELFDEIVDRVQDLSGVEAHAPDGLHGHLAALEKRNPAIEGAGCRERDERFLHRCVQRFGRRRFEGLDPRHRCDQGHQEHHAQAPGCSESGLHRDWLLLFNWAPAIRPDPSHDDPMICKPAR